MRKHIRSFGLALGLLLPVFGAAPRVAHAAASQSQLGAAAVRQAVATYAKQRGLRPERMSVEVLGVSASGKSTRATLRVDGKAATVAINHGDARVQSHQVGELVEALLAGHKPYKRAGLGQGSRYANMLVNFAPGEGATLGVAGLRSAAAAPLGRPRAGQAASTQALDALSLGDGGAITVALGRDLVAGRRGAGIRVRENGIADATGKIINQTPGLVEVMVGNKWHRLGYAGYTAAGDALTFAKAIDPIPAGAKISLVRVSDAPNAPHTFDPTNNAVAAARGVKGFDLVSVEGLAGLGK